MSKENLPQEIENKDEFIREFFIIQQQEISIKRDELSIKRDEIAIRQSENELNQQISLAAIQSQEKVELKRGEIYLATQKGKFWLWGIVATFLTVVVCLAMYLDKADIAIRIIEIAGAVLLGYFAGVNRGKTQILEQLNQQSSEK